MGQRWITPYDAKRGDKKQSDGYKPSSSPRALELVQIERTDEEAGANRMEVIKNNSGIERATGLHLMNIPVSNLQRSVDFYVNKLGFELRRAPDPYTNAIVAVGGSPSVFLQHEPAYRLGEGCRQAVTFEIGTRDIESFYRQLLAENVRVGGRYDNPGCGKYFDVFDPDGHKITVCQDWYNRF